MLKLLPLLILFCGTITEGKRKKSLLSSPDDECPVTEVNGFLKRKCGNGTYRCPTSNTRYTVSVLFHARQMRTSLDKKCPGDTENFQVSDF